MIKRETEQERSVPRMIKGNCLRERTREIGEKGEERDKKDDEK